MFVPSRSALPITVQPSISTIPCKTLNHLIPPVLFSSVFANPHLRPPAPATSANLPPRPESVSSPSPLPVRRSYRPDRGDLRGLCVKISPPLHSNLPVQPSAALQMFVNPALQTVVLCHPLHQNQKSRPLFSTACALFCNYGGGGGSPQVALSQRNRQHSPSLPSCTNAAAPQTLSSRTRARCWHAARGICFSSASFTSSTSSTSRTSSSLTPLESALASQFRVLPCFDRNHPPINSLESALTRSAPVTSLESAHTKQDYVLDKRKRLA